MPALSLVLKRVLHGGARQPVRAEFRFDPATPMVVPVVLTPHRAPGVTWHIGRELLYMGLFVKSGEGHVQVWPARGREDEAAYLRLSSTDSCALLELPLPPLADWLEATYDEVPVEAESDVLDWDAIIAGLLKD